MPNPEAAAALAPGQVRIAVHAGGLNFRDALNALGMYPGDAGRLGLEGAGVITEVAPEVVHLAPGDRVMGLLPTGLGPIAVVDHRLVVRIPPGMSFTTAAALPVVYLTVYYALVELGRVRPGERVLVHAAAGGVGMAAVQLARHLGAEVFATAHPSKWGVLASQQLEPSHVASSRTAEFEPRFLAHTGGQGVDVVLNSLARELVDASLRLLPRGGRFLEMGKLDVRDPDAIAAAHPGVAYRAFDVMEAGPERIQAMLRQIVELVERGVLAAPPVTTLPVDRASEALGTLAHARHVGKLVLRMPAALDPEGTVILTGGTGTLGGLVARHLVERHGVRHLVLASRRGRAAPGADALVHELAMRGASACVETCDVADRAAVARLLSSVPREHPVTAVIHAAGVIEDGLLAAQTPERLARVLAAKLDGARHLDELTCDLDLAAFVVFSSFAGVAGSPGQASYAAANSALDALASQRRASGLPALSLAWGFWEPPSGMTAHLTDGDRRRIARHGVVPLSAEEGLALLDRALLEVTTGDALVAPLRLDQRALARAAQGVPALFRG
ncbi:MAG TPA: MDR/SDR family oxidoreductase, partial [Kofleriaceae bacterium]|nr:MDR/SDR family oxidoreductase [Kofleriaceae bacterium]